MMLATSALRKRLNAYTIDHNTPQYKVAQLAGFDPTRLSHLVRGAARARRNDPKVIRLLEIINMEFDEAFVDVDRVRLSRQREIVTS